MSKLLAVMAALVLLVGCGSGVTSSLPAGGAATAEARAEDASAPMPGDAGAPTSPLSPQIARSAAVTLRIQDLLAAATKLREVAAAAGGRIVSENLVLSSPDQPHSYLVLAVPADRLDATLDELATIGKVESRSVQAVDVTTSVADVDARVAALNAAITRLTELSKQAGSVADLVVVETELSNRISERDSMLAQQRALRELVAESQVQVELITPDQATPLQTTGFLGGLQAGWNALVATGQVLLTVVGAVLPFAVVVAVVLVPLLVWVRRRRRRRLTAQAATSTAAEPVPPATATPATD